jgi:hypothetical protein
MAAHPPFVPGLKLGRMLYEEAAREIIEGIVPSPDYCAALLGSGSDVLGYDTERSTDHDWGPRFQVYLPEKLHAEKASALDDALHRQLPGIFHGHPVGSVQITQITRCLHWHLGVDSIDGLAPLDWLGFPEQRLLELTSGAVFHDPRGELVAMRAALAYFPRDVWLYRMACQWQRLFQEEAFVGRCAEVGDAVGTKLMAARIAQDLVKLFFLQARRYAPYGKWLGTAFAALPMATVALPNVRAALESAGYPALEAALGALYQLAAEQHNALSLTPALDPSPRQFFDRPYLVIRAERFANALLAAIESPELRGLTVRIGGIDQFSDSTDFIENVSMYGKTKGLYR